jgi:CRISPR/Cas system CSM-associated protein Csm3 (group 7 of RAMP superfamily)
MEPTFKGGKLINRYKIVGTLSALSSIHIGDGNMDSNPDRLPPPDDDKSDEVPKYSTVVTDVKGRAYIPGSTIKGRLRSWLTQIFSDFSLACLNSNKRAIALKDVAEELKEGKKTQLQIHSLLKQAELLFGSAINEGKAEFWDAPMETTPQLPPGISAQCYSGYDATRGTILLKSVAIDLVTGTAAKNKLFNYEVVPKGAKFSLTVAGQNLSEEELGMVLFALDGFNSFIYPVTLGAMGSVGFGRFAFDSLKIFYLCSENFKEWLLDAIQTGQAGYTKLPALSESEQTNIINTFKMKFMDRIT